MGSLSYVHNKQYAVWLQLGCVQGLHLVMRIWTFPKREVRKGRRKVKVWFDIMKMPRLLLVSRKA